MTAPVKTPLRLDAENCGGGVNLHAVVDGAGAVVAWTTRCVVGGREVVSDAEAKATARAIAHRYNVHEELVAAVVASVGRCQFDCTPKSYCGRCEPLLAVLAKAEAGP